MKVKKISVATALVLSGGIVSGCGVGGYFVGGNSHRMSKSIKISGNTATKSSKASADAGSKSNLSTSPSYPSFGLGTSGPSVLALNERLAELGYLPLNISGNLPTITLNTLSSPAQANFKWRYGNIPSALRAQWNPSAYTELTRSAIIAVEHQNGLAVDGIVGPQVWQTLLSANAKHDAYPFTFVLVKKDPAPEHMQVWEEGKWVYSSVVNTGVKQAPSTDGTFAVYLRYVSQTMSGTNPNGTHYRDKGVPFVNYYDGSEAIHGFVRSQYGFPQSVGCVELPVTHAKTVWSLLHYGTLVTVEGHYVAPTDTHHPSSGTKQPQTGTKTSSTPSNPSSGGSSNNTSGTGNTTSNTAGNGSTANNSTTNTSGAGSTTNNTTSNAAGSSGTANTSSTANGTANAAAPTGNSAAGSSSTPTGNVSSSAGTSSTNTAQ